MTLEKDALEVLSQVIDPEVGVNIVDLGLVYSVVLDENRLTAIITVTSASCPLGELIREEARSVLRERFPDLEGVKVEITFDPPWNPEMMSDAAKKILGGE